MNGTRVVGISWAIAAAALASTAEVDVDLLGGQSNMQGIGKLADLPANDRGHRAPA